MTNILVAHHLSIIADLEPSKGAQHRQQAFKAVDEAIATFEKVGVEYVSSVGSQY